MMQKVALKKAKKVEQNVEAFSCSAKCTAYGASSCGTSCTGTSIFTTYEASAIYSATNNMSLYG